MAPLSKRADYSGAVCAASLLGLLTLPNQALAQQIPLEGPQAIVEIGDDVATQAHGRLAVNAAAGNNNQQASSAVIAVAAIGLSTGSIRQRQLTNGGTSGSASASISGSAFAGSAGITSVNVAAGSDNQEANLAVIAIGFEGQALTEAMLSQTRASQQPSGGPDGSAPPEYAANLSPGAFHGSSGLVQVNLVGGERNSSANTFALTVSVGAEP